MIVTHFQLGAVVAAESPAGFVESQGRPGDRRVLIGLNERMMKIQECPFERMLSPVDFRLFWGPSATSTIVLLPAIGIYRVYMTILTGPGL